MNTYTKKTISDLTVESVSILTQEFHTITEVELQIVDGVETEVNVEKEVQVGDNHRCAYSNTAADREQLILAEPEDIVVEVMEVWGDAPALEEPSFDDYVVEPTTEDIINALLGLEG